MKDIPFVFGKIVSFPDFTDRENELKMLENNFVSSINTTLISPRRWGKTSLVKKAAELVRNKNKNIKIILVDIFNIRNEEDFYLTLAKSVLNETASKWEEIVENTKQFLSHLLPKISLSDGLHNEISFGVEWAEAKKSADDILNLAENIAIKKNIKIVICIDEFQSISDFENPLAFQKKLRSNWQKHSHVSYCIYGSKRHMLMDIFTNSSMPFYKFGTIMFLEKIPTNIWQEFIVRRFSETNKKINEENAGLIAELVENHPYYVQQLAQQSWLLCKKTCHKTDIEAAYQNIINQLSLLFVNMTENLPTSQLNFIKALLSGEKQLSSQQTLKKYNLGTSANVIRIRKNLLEREIIDVTPDGIELQDPMFKGWFKQTYHI